MFSSKVGTTADDFVTNPQSPKFKELSVNYDEVDVDTDDLKATATFQDKSKPRLARYYRSPFIQEPLSDLEKTKSVPVILEVSESLAMGLELDSSGLGLANSSSEQPLLSPLRSLKKVSAKIGDSIEQPNEAYHYHYHNHQNHPYNYIKSSQSHFLLSENTHAFNYEYPILVASLKSVYRELAITFALYVLNVVSAVGIVLINKFIYSHFKFPHGIVLTFYHFLLTGMGLQILTWMRVFVVKPVNVLQILPLSASFCSYVVLTNLSLQYNSGTFYQVRM